MTDPTLAPRHSDQGMIQGQPNDPFATPTVAPADLPQSPEPVASIHSRSQIYTPHQQPFTNPTTFLPNVSPRHEQAWYPYKSASMSSSGNSSTMTGISSVELEKGALGKEQPQPKQKSTSRDRQCRDVRTRDPEKAAHGPISPQRQSRGNAARITYLEDDEPDEARQTQEAKAVKILLYLSGPCVVMSFLNAIWTFVSLLIISLAQPVRLCARRPTFGQQLGGLLGPALNLQLKRIYTPLPPHANEDTSYRTGMLLTVQLLSPFLSLGMAIAAWVVAIFWISSVVVGDPAGTDKRDDGRETVLALRNWWETWLVRSMKEE